ncbi:MAG: cryptochrome/photolyase family protein [Bacteroidetes bacterium]|nr:cryptochrome/photolyase family protein [Bacteroidota bacterium]
MKSVNLIFPHQLFEESPLELKKRPSCIVEEYLFFRQYAFHKQKIAFHRASMKKYAEYLENKGAKVVYIETTEQESDVRELIGSLAAKGLEELHFIDPTDDWLSKRIRTFAEKHKIKTVKKDSPLFLNSPAELKDFFDPEKESYFQTDFYISQRKRLNILLEDGKPAGGKWSFDKENRKKYPKKKSPPEINFPKMDSSRKAAMEYVEKHFPDNPGNLEDFPLYPDDFGASRTWLKQFLKNRFTEFGPYEDAIVREESFLNHSVLTPMLNVGLLPPEIILEEVLAFAEKEAVPLNSTEGFVRQIIGWREFMRGMYEARGVEARTTNFWGFRRKIPDSFYDGSTGIVPLDDTIKKVLRYGYCHHIERLMILGNFMLLCEFDPKEVYRWFMELFIDAYDWVMVPNVYGMSQFADGGLFATKPYISGSNYVRKMSNYGKGDWCDTWDALFWRFMHEHRDFFSGNPRLSMLLGNLNRMSDEKLEGLLKRANDFLDSL